jgi:hypothetical protein
MLPEFPQAQWVIPLVSPTIAFLMVEALADRLCRCRQAECLLGGSIINARRFRLFKGITWQPSAFHAALEYGEHQLARAWRVIDAPPQRFEVGGPVPPIDRAGWLDRLAAARPPRKRRFVADVLKLPTRLSRQAKIIAGLKQEMAALGRSPALGQYVTLDEMAAIVNRSKRTLEKLKDRKKDPLPPPDIEGGGGKPHEWLWSTVRPWLEKEYGRTLPAEFPAARIRGVRADRN